MERPYLPDGKVEPVDIDDVHFAVAFRGYRMDQVDSVLDRLAEELIKRDQHITRLERIVHSQTVQSAVGYGNNRSNRVGADTGSMPTVQNDQVNPPAEPRRGQPDDTSG
jgi:DivIVA domain-containing protein